MYFNIKVISKKKKSFIIYFIKGNKKLRIGFCKIDLLFNFFFFINYKKLLKIFLKKENFIYKFRTTFKFSLKNLKIFIGFLKIFLKVNINSNGCKTIY